MHSSTRQRNWTNWDLLSLLLFHIFCCSCKSRLSFIPNFQNLSSFGEIYLLLKKKIEKQGAYQKQNYFIFNFIQTKSIVSSRQDFRQVKDGTQTDGTLMFTWVAHLTHSLLFPTFVGHCSLMIHRRKFSPLNPNHVCDVMSMHGNILHFQLRR